MNLRREEGTAAVELAILAPVVLALLGAVRHVEATDASYDMLRAAAKQAGMLK